MLPATTTRVIEHSPARYNEQIRYQTEANIARYAEDPASINRRLEELEREWDMERLLEANAASLTLAGLALGATVDRRFYWLPAAASGFLLMHALQGWCPPVPLFRRLGVRTASEIDHERYALKAMRGDFRQVPPASPGHDGWVAHSAYDAVRR